MAKKTKIGKYIILGGAALLSLYFLSKKKADEGDTGGYGAGGIGGYLPDFSGVLDGIDKAIKSIGQTTKNVTETIPQTITQTEQLARYAGAYSLLTMSGVPTQPTLYPSGSISITPLAGTPTTSRNEVARLIEAASVATGAGNFNFASGGTAYVAPTDASRTGTPFYGTPATSAVTTKTSSTAPTASFGGISMLAGAPTSIPTAVTSSGGVVSQTSTTSAKVTTSNQTIAIRANTGRF